MKKYYLNRVLFLMIIITAVIGVNGCAVSKNSVRSSYVSDYKSASINHFSEAIIIEKSGFDKQWVEAKITFALGNMKADGLYQRIAKTYSDNLYFNDTLRTHTSATELAKYMEEMAERVHSIKIEFDDVIISDKDAYVRWSMAFKSKADSEPVSSIGMSHLRFNAQGKVILHQDYWDGIEGFYRTVPVLGFMLEKVKNFL